MGFTDVPSSLPMVGKQHGFLADLRTRLASMGSLLPVIEAGYEKYSKAGLNFVIPGFNRAMILVPSSQVKWVTDQADSVLNAAAMQIEVLQSDWTLLDSSMARNPVHEIIIRRDLTRSLGALIPGIEEELNIAIDEYWGKDTENWVDVGAFTTMMKATARTSNRIFVGLPLCIIGRNDEYLDNAGAFSTDIAISGALINLIPSILKPLLAWICLLPNRWHLYKCSKYLRPFINQRIKDLNNAREAGETTEKWNDFTTWYLEEVADNPDPTLRSPEKIMKRLMTVNFAAIHTSTLTATNMLFDLFSSSNAADNVQEIRQEILQVLSEHDGKWDKNALGKLIKTDSAIRESLRISTFMSHGMSRLVVDPKGLTMPDGLHLPPGTRIGTSTHSIHHDDEIYDNPKIYDPFRFSRAREATEKGNSRANGTAITNVENPKDHAKVLESKNLAMVTTSDTFLAFGHGRHACPGRFFAAAEMKLLLAYIVLNYDIKPIGFRPANGTIGAAILPPMKASISVKRRKN
ncbi:cytochrome P450 [Acephala macrosclerotiorum]|nr:cytochrome P450 [Acephala macrosclerotiorum]